MKHIQLSSLSDLSRQIREKIKRKHEDKSVHCPLHMHMQHTSFCVRYDMNHMLVVVGFYLFNGL